MHSAHPHKVLNVYKLNSISCYVPYLFILNEYIDSYKAIVPENKHEWGEKLPNGTWNGMFGMVQRGVSIEDILRLEQLDIRTNILYNEIHFSGYSSIILKFDLNSCYHYNLCVPNFKFCTMVNEIK